METSLTAIEEVPLGSSPISINKKPYFSNILRKINNFLADVRSLKKDINYIPTLKSLPSAATLRRRNKEIKRLKKRLIEKSDAHDLQNKLAAQRFDEWSNLNKVFQDLIQENDLLKKLNSDLSIQLCDLNKLVADQQQHFQEELSDLKFQLELQHEKVKILESRNKELNQQIDEKNDTISILKKERSSLQSKLDSYQPTTSKKTSSANPKGKQDMNDLLAQFYASPPISEEDYDTGFTFKYDRETKDVKIKQKVLDVGTKNEDTDLEALDNVISSRIRYGQTTFTQPTPQNVALNAQSSTRFNGPPQAFGTGQFSSTIPPVEKKNNSNTRGKLAKKRFKCPP